MLRASVLHDKMFRENQQTCQSRYTLAPSPYAEIRSRAACAVDGPDDDATAKDWGANAIGLK